MELHMDHQLSCEVGRERCGREAAAEFIRVIALEAEVERLHRIIEGQAACLIRNPDD